MKFKDTYDFLRKFRDDKENMIVGLMHENPTVKADFTGVVHMPIEIEKLNAPYGKWVGYHKNSRYFINTQNDKKGKGVFFVVNHGGKSNKEIDSIRAWFIDVDFAKVQKDFADENRANQYLKELEETGEYISVNIETVLVKEKLKYIVRSVYKQEKIKYSKQQFRLKFEKELKDAEIVETYSGYHVYWEAERGTNTKNFVKIQKALIQKFGSDNQIVKLANLMRVPGFYHQKYGEKFLVEIVQKSEKRFTEEEFVSSLGLDLKEKQSKGFAKKEIDEKLSYGSHLTRTLTIIQPQHKSDMIFKNIAPFGAMEKLTFNETLERVLQQPLSSFVEYPVMEKGPNIKCPFHDDGKGSASVFESETGEEVFHCHACEIGTRNAIGLYMTHTGKGWRKSVEELARIINIKVIETDFEREQFQKYRENRHYFEQDLETLLPFTSKWIDKYGRRAYLRYFNDKAETKVTKEEFQYNGHNVFFVSYRMIAKELNNKNMQSVQNTVILLNVLGFVERVPEGSIPIDLKKRAEQERRILQKELRLQGAEKRADAVRLINFYIVPNWNDNAFEIEKTARILKENGFSVTKHKNKIAIEKLLGSAVANRVFPDGRVVPKRFTNILEKLEEYIKKDIKEKGYAIGEEILRNKIREKGRNGVTEVVSLEEKEDAFKRGILVNPVFKVIKVRSDKKKKELGYTQKTPTTIHVIELK